MSFNVEKPEDSPGFLLWQVTNLWQREIKKSLEYYDLTHPQFVILASTYWFELKNIEPTQIFLSNHSKIDPMTTSTILKNLEKKSYIVRTNSTVDTRAKLIKLTKIGREKTRVAVKKIDEIFFSRLGAQKNTMIKLLELLSEFPLQSAPA